MVVMMMVMMKFTNGLLDFHLPLKIEVEFMQKGGDSRDISAETHRRYFYWKCLPLQIDLCRNLRTNGFGWFLLGRPTDTRWRWGLCEKSGQEESSLTEIQKKRPHKIQITNHTEMPIRQMRKNICAKIWLRWGLCEKFGRAGSSRRRGGGRLHHRNIQINILT